MAKVTFWSYGTTTSRARRGYHLAVPVNAKDLPASFIERVTTKTGAVILNTMQCCVDLTLEALAVSNLLLYKATGFSERTA